MKSLVLEKNEEWILSNFLFFTFWKHDHTTMQFKDILHSEILNAIRHSCIMRHNITKNEENTPKFGTFTKVQHSSSNSV